MSNKLIIINFFKNFNGGIVMLSIKYYVGIRSNDYANKDLKAI